MAEFTEQFLEFKYKRNVMLELGDGKQYPIPMRMFKVPVEENPMQPLQPLFDMGFVHKISLADETVQMPERDENMPQRHYDELVDEAYREARTARELNDKIRKTVYHHQRHGNVEIVKDPFERRVIKGETVKKPSEIAKEIEEAKAARPATKAAADKSVA